MKSTEKIKYIIEDEAIIELFGRQNFSTKESAVFELIKNSYDAGATECIITIGDDDLSFCDNGSGMNYMDIQEKWMKVGKSEKGYKSSENDRILAGSKGIGRFALARLGNKVELITYNGIDNAVLWETDWRNTTISNEDSKKNGTNIVVSNLREKWRKKDVYKLIDFLNRVIYSNSIKVTLKWQGHNFNINPVMKNLVIGIDYTQRFKLEYDSKSLKLRIKVYNDEFQETASNIIKDISLDGCSEEVDIYEEFKAKYNNEQDFDDNIPLNSLLSELGSFSAEMYFGISPTKQDVEDFHYKHQKIEKEKHHGIILYRNNFSIASYEGKRDWLGIEGRVRKSPAAASNKNGAWRVRKNQITGYVIIDKKKNNKLEDLSNRQGLEENDYYELFIEIINHGISVFERYRQSIIRKLKYENENKNDKNIKNYQGESNDALIKFLNKPKENYSKEEFQEIANSVKNIKVDIEKQKKESKEIEEKFRYETRILNVLATQGLRASTLAHDLHTHNNFLTSVNQNIIDSLNKMGYWELIVEKSKELRSYEDIPRLLEKNNDINLSISKFVSTILKNVEKSSFVNNIESIEETLRKILEEWSYQYKKIHYHLDVEEFMYNGDVTFDTIAVIFDNLILNSLQNNPHTNLLSINIKVSSNSNLFLINYADDGIGLPQKYHNNPRRILEVHESSRKDGHGLGMWIVYSSILRTQGEIVDIKVDGGFGITFSIGGKYE